MGIRNPNTINRQQNGKITWPNNTDKGPQIRYGANCHMKTKVLSHKIKDKHRIFNPSNQDITQDDVGVFNGCKHKIIYKPNNIKFAQQGATTSASRIKRLRYDTLTNNGSQFNSSIGARGTNDGTYLFNAMDQYFIKTKYQAFIRHTKQGNHTNCFLTPTGSVGGATPITQQSESVAPKQVKYKCGYGDDAGKCIPDPQGIYTKEECDSGQACTTCRVCSEDLPCLSINQDSGVASCVSTILSPDATGPDPVQICPEGSSLCESNPNIDACNLCYQNSKYLPCASKTPSGHWACSAVNGDTSTCDDTNSNSGTESCGVGYICTNVSPPDPDPPGPDPPFMDDSNCTICDFTQFSSGICYSDNTTCTNSCQTLFCDDKTDPDNPTCQPCKPNQDECTTNCNDYCGKFYCDTSQHPPSPRHCTKDTNDPVAVCSSKSDIDKFCGSKKCDAGSALDFLFGLESTNSCVYCTFTDYKLHPSECVKPEGNYYKNVCGDGGAGGGTCGNYKCKSNPSNVEALNFLSWETFDSSLTLGPCDRCTDINECKDDNYNLTTNDNCSFCNSFLCNSGDSPVCSKPCLDADGNNSCTSGKSYVNNKDDCSFCNSFLCNSGDSPVCSKPCLDADGNNSCTSGKSYVNNKDDCSFCNSFLCNSGDSPVCSKPCLDADGNNSCTSGKSYVNNKDDCSFCNSFLCNSGDSPVCSKPCLDADGNNSCTSGKSYVNNKDDCDYCNKYYCNSKGETTPCISNGKNSCTGKTYSKDDADNICGYNYCKGAEDTTCTSCQSYSGEGDNPCLNLDNDQVKNKKCENLKCNLSICLADTAGALGCSSCWQSNGTWGIGGGTDPCGTSPDTFDYSKGYATIQECKKKMWKIRLYTYR